MAVEPVATIPERPQADWKGKWSLWLAVVSLWLLLFTAFPGIILLNHVFYGTEGHVPFLVAFGASAVPVLMLDVLATIIGVLALREHHRGASQTERRSEGRRRAILGIIAASLSAMLVLAYCMALRAAQEAFRMTLCRNYLMQIALAMANYHELNGSYPPAATYDAQGQPLLSWRVLILPFLEEDELYQQFRLDESWDSPHNRPLADRIPRVYRCPSGPGRMPNATGYVAVTGDRTVFPPHRCVSQREITDGPARTVMVVEISSSTITWTKPEDLVFHESFPDPEKLPSPHAGGRAVLFVDGTTPFLSNNINHKTWRALMTIQGGEPVSLDDF